MTDLKLSLEFFPPKSETGDQNFWKTLDRMTALDPAFVSVTYGAGGTTQERSDRIVRRISEEASLDAAAHLTCVGTSRANVDALAKSWYEAGIKRIVALRGDAPDADGVYRPHKEGYVNAIDLVGGLKRVAPFDISVAAYPEKHPQSPSVAVDLDNLWRKFNAGADRAITQFFFEAETFLRFRDRAARAGIFKPIVPGILPIANFAKTVMIAKQCETAVPQWLAETFEGLDEDPETRALVSASVTADLCERLRSEGVDHFHFYTLNQAPLTMAVWRRLTNLPEQSFSNAA